MHLYSLGCNHQGIAFLCGRGHVYTSVESDLRSHWPQTCLARRRRGSLRLDDILRTVEDILVSRYEVRINS